MMNINMIGMWAGIVLIIISIFRIVKKYYKPNKWWLLHMIKRRYIWYKNDNESWVVIDTSTKEVDIIKKSNTAGYTEKEIEMSHFNSLKSKLVERYVPNYWKIIIYRKANRIYQKKLNGTNS